MSAPDSSTRRGFFEIAAGASVVLAAAPQLKAQSAGTSWAGTAYHAPGANPFKDPSYAAGAKMRNVQRTVRRKSS